MTNRSPNMVSCVVSALIGASTAAMAAPSTQFPTYTVGPQSNGSYVMSTGQIITPAGTVINLTDNLTGTQSPVRAKAIALNPVNHNFAAVLAPIKADTTHETTLDDLLVMNFLPKGSAD